MSVFAYVSEIEAWLNQTREPGTPDAPQPPQRVWRLPWIAAALLLGAGILASLAVLNLKALDEGLTATLIDDAIVARDGAGSERWRHAFGGMRVEAPSERRRHPVEIVRGAHPRVIAATGLQVSMADETVGGGQLLSLTLNGALANVFSFDDRLTFGAGTYERPWGITDFRVAERGGGRSIAVAAHHHQWWPSIVTILDDRWQRRGAFVNAGWLERVHWLSHDRLVVGGFSEASDGGVVALLDPNALDGQSPVSRDSRFYCTDCGPHGPIRYAVMPRSEVNRVTSSRFNRARLEIGSDAIVARTVEAQLTEADAVDALYEFTLALDLVRASYGERYWELHRSLEVAGKLNHTRAQCPDRDGPRSIQLWAPETGWRTVLVPQASSTAARGR